MIYLDFLSVFHHSSFNCVSLQSKITKTILIKIILIQACIFLNCLEKEDYS